MQGLAPFQLNLQRRQETAGEDIMTKGPGSHFSRVQKAQHLVTQGHFCYTAHKAVTSIWELCGMATVGLG